MLSSDTQQMLPATLYCSALPGACCALVLRDHGAPQASANTLASQVGGRALCCGRVRSGLPL